MKLATQLTAAAVIFLCLSLTTLSSGFAADNNDASPEQLESVKKAIKQVNAWLKRASSKRSGLEQTLQKNESKISQLAKDIHRTTENLQRSKAHIKQLENRQKDLQLELRKQQQHLSEQITSTYSLGNQPAVKLLLSHENPQLLGRTFSYFEYISQAHIDKIQSFRSTIQTLNETEQRINQENQALFKQKKTLENQQHKLKEASEKRKQALIRLATSIKGKQQELNRLQENHKRLEQLLEEVEKAIASIPQPQESTPFAKLKSKLPWPSRGKVKQHFGERIRESSLRSNGIVIDTKEGSTVKAVHYGRVIFSEWIRGFGLMLIIDHGQGYMTIYGNNKSLLKETGEWVLPGDTIAYAGSSGGDNLPGLYFEIRKRGKPQNPLRWLTR